MKVFMLGWEFPPVISGGLGVACYGLAKALNSMGTDVIFVLPKPLARNGKKTLPSAIAIAQATNAPSAASTLKTTAAAKARQPNGTSGQPGMAAPQLPGDPNGGRSNIQIKNVPAATSEDVQHAVEQALAGSHDPEPAPASPPGDVPAPATAAGESQTFHSDVTQQTDTVEEEALKRVTFVPVDVWLQPYMTPQQYLRMVVEEITTSRPKAPWETHGDPFGSRWVERAVAAGAQGSMQQPPNHPGPPPHSAGKGGLSAQAVPAPPPIAPKASKHSAQSHPHGAPTAAQIGEAPRVVGPADTAYAGDLFTETERYARLALTVARSEKFNLVHAHDWMTFEAAMAVASASGKPLVVQIHSTELDRAGTQANARIMEIERQGMTAADRVIAVSYRTKTQLIEKYGIDPRKIEVVYNATEIPAGDTSHQAPPLRKKQKTVLFLGRLTEQKGPDYFLRAARKVLSLEPDVKFVIAGKGDMLEELKTLSTELGIRKKVLFTGFLKKDPAEKAFKAADVYVMPSLSEPFGIAPLEALSHDVPVIISKQSGVGEVLNHVLKVDFWDTDDLANKILAVLRHPPLAQTLREKGQREVRQLSWDDSARRIAELYEHLTGAAAPFPVTQ